MELFVIFVLRVSFPAAILEKNEKRYFKTLYSIFLVQTYVGKATKAFLTIRSGFRSWR